MVATIPGLAAKAEEPVAVTGATGFIGGEVVRQLTGGGFPVRALVRPAKAGRRQDRPGVAWLNGTLGDAAALVRLVRGCRMVVHCAGATRGLTPDDFREVNENGVRRLAAAIHSLPPVKRPRLLHISSLAAREPHLSPYAASKRGGELVLETEFADLPYTILRPPAVYGPGDRELRPLLRWLARGVLFAPGGAAARLSLLHVSDLAAAVRAWLEYGRGRDEGRTFTLDDGRPGGYAWEDIRRCGVDFRRRPVLRLNVPRRVVRLAAGINTARARLVVGCRPMLTAGKVRELYHPDWVCGHQELRAACGWEPRIRLLDGLRLMAGDDCGRRFGTIPGDVS
ncbi:MAG: NAD-dependent epimerase/dehydratase family protein [Deltaproteobacteria bacterium]|nr:NAD-dependent epimerase/dehydratase family protein [Candidatus Anaeroferrophillacea bacterium]